MGKKFKMPKLEEFLEKKTTGGTKSDPIWVTLEKEMRENTEKPYNEKVGNWLKYLKDLKYHFHCEAQRKENRLNAEVGPAWYIELSSAQREVLANLKTSIHADLLEDIPNRVRRSLSDLGITMKISKKILMKAMGDSVEDPGVFIWNLYSEIYKTSPSELQPRYDINAMILMSSLVFIDLDECVKKLNDLTHSPKPPPPPPKPKKPKPKPSTEPLGMYKQEQTVPFVSNHPSEQPKKKKPLPIGYKFRLRSESSYEKITKDQSFLDKRKDRNKKEKQVERECNYKFWEPPSTLRNTDPKMAAYVNKLKMFKKRAKPKHKAPFNNAQYLVGGVSFTGGTPSYIIQNVSLLPTGYIPINGGVVAFGKEFVTWIQGYWKYPREVIEKCASTCDCLTLWESKAMEYIHASKCKCGHLYDYHNEGKVKEKYFYPPNKHGSFWIDKAKIYQLDPTEDFIRDTFADALKSIETTPQPSTPTISASGLKEKELVAAFLADVADTPLVIPHLPQANLLNNLQEWARKRVKGDLTPKQGKKLLHKSQRRWLDLKGIDFVANANMIPFTLKQLENMDWSHRELIQNLFQILMNDFVDRNRLKQVEQTRLWWATTQYDAYPSKAFLDIFYTYMPPRVKDTFLIDPYSHARTPKYGAKTCPLR